MSEFPQGPLPSDFEESVAAIIRDVGVSILTKKVLRKRLESQYGIEFSSHDAALVATLGKLMKTNEFQRELAKACGDMEVGGKGKKRASSAVDKGKKTKGKKEKKPTDYPKAALSSFIIFCNENREKVKAENPNIQVREVLSKLGDMWKTASEDSKSRYVKLAEADKARFERDMEAYKARGGKVHRSSRKEVKDPNAPKRSRSAYLFFANDFREKHPDMKMTEQLRAAGPAWKALTAEERKPYEDMAAKDKERYARECGSAKPTARKAAAPSLSDDSSSASSDSESD